MPDPDEMYTQTLILEQRQQLEQQFAQRISYYEEERAKIYDKYPKISADSVIDNRGNPIVAQEK